MNRLTQNELILNQPQLLDQNPAAIYISSLHAETGRRTQAQALLVIARILGADYDHLNWGALRYQHTAVIRARITQLYIPSKANKIFSTLRQTLKQARLLEQMTAEDYRRAIEVEPVTRETLSIGRELPTCEVLALMNTCQRNKNDMEGTRERGNHQHHVCSWASSYRSSQSYGGLLQFRNRKANLHWQE